MFLFPAVSFQRPEEELVCCCARTRWSPEVAERVGDLVRRGLDWETVWELARRHRLRPLLHHALLGMGVEAVPASVMGRLQRERQALAVQGLLRTRELVRVLKLLREHGIEALTFKGPVLGQEVYGDIGLRPFGDLDLLLQRPNLLRAKELLCAEGYRPDPVMDEHEERAYLDDQFAYCFIYDGLGVEVELHWALTHRHFPFRVDMDAVWERSRQTPLGGDTVRTLGLDDLLIFLCAHGAKHEWKQLVWLCDVAELLRRNPTLDETRLLARASDAKAMRMLKLGLLLAYRLFQAPLSPCLLVACREDTALVRAADRIIAHAFREDVGELRFAERVRFHFVARDVWRDKVESLLQNVRLATAPSPKDRAFVSLPERWRLLYYVVRPFRIIRSVGAAKTKDRRRVPEDATA